MNPRDSADHLPQDRRLRSLRLRVFKPPTLTKTDIIGGLRKLGLKEGDEVMVHSSLAGLAPVEGGAAIIIDAFLEAVGPTGTVLMPSFAEHALRRGVFGSWWDPKTTPVCTGEISELFWRRPEALRSDHPTHSVAAIGRRAEFFTCRHGMAGDRYGHWGTGAFSSWSPWAKMVAEDVHVMMLGVNVATIGHYVEAHLVTEHLEGLPSAEERGFAAGLMHKHYNCNGVWPNIGARLCSAYLKRRRAGAPLGTSPEYKRLLLEQRPCRPDPVVIGQRMYWRFSAAEYFRWGVDTCRKNPQTWFDPDYLAWKALVDRRRDEIQVLTTGQGPPLQRKYRRNLKYYVKRVTNAPRVRRLRRRIFKPPTVTKADIVRGLHQVGLKEGDEVLFHSSLSALGNVEGGADTVIDAYLEAVGPEGTVLVPSYPNYLLCRGEFGSWWDPQSTPVGTGRISELLWRRPEARRSNHPTHAVAAIGRRAEYFTSEHGTEGDRYGQWGTGDFSSWSPWTKMVEEDINYMLIGIVKACTLGYHAMAHVVTEHLKGLPEVEEKGLATALLHIHYGRTGVSPKVPTKLRAAYLQRWQPGAPTGTPAEYKKLPPLERPCRPDRVVIGKGVYWRFSAAEYFHWCIDALLRNPEAWCDEDYLAWKARVDRRRAEIQAQGVRTDIPQSWVRQDYSPR